MATIICGLLSPLLKSNKLIAQVDERHRVTLATKFEIEKATIKRQRLLDIAECDMVDPDNARP
jgi:hypothetical protein